jgi:phosphate-selective porin OprO/OprP
MNSLRRHIAIFLLTGLGILQVPAQDTVSIKFSPIKYGNKGFELRDAVGNNLMHLEFRGQFRLAYPTDTDPITENDFQDENLYLGLNRARIKVGGHSYRPWLGYFVEYELQSGYLLDFRLMFTKYPWMKVKVGQWKVQYNRERIISSGKQQTMERSILTRAFTVDRQQGLSLYGHFDGAGAANFNYWISAFMGTGRGNKFNDDKHLMYMSRLQWNILGKPIKFTGSDLEYYKQPSLLIAFGALTNQSPYTRFSAQGGGQLEGFEEEAPGQYRVNQFLGETAFKYRGWGWQQEFHFKQIKDNEKCLNLFNNHINV